jgi:hypothetical protein
MRKSQHLRRTPSGAATVHRFDHRAPVLERRLLLRGGPRRQPSCESLLKDLELRERIRAPVEELGLLQHAKVGADRLAPHA